MPLTRQSEGGLGFLETALGEEEALARDMESGAADRRLERELCLFRELFELAPDAYIVTDGRGRIRLCNRAAERMFGYRNDEALGRPISMLIEGPDHDFRSATNRTVERRGSRK